MAGAKRGPKPAPSNVVELAGNPGKRRRAPEPKPRDASLEAPKDLTPLARGFWKRHAPELASLGLLTVSDVDSFGACCEAWAVMQAAKKALRGSATGNVTKLFTADRAHGGEPRKHPAWTVYKQAESSYIMWAREFGLTPSARVSLPAPGDDADEDEDLFG